MERKEKSDGSQSTSSLFKNMKSPIAGGVSGFITRALTQPLDCIKVRHQLQVEPIQKNAKSKYTSTAQTFMLIYREEGIRGLWKGHVPGQILSVTYGFAQFFAYDQFNRHSQCIEFFRKHSDVRHSLAGGFGGAFAMTISTPFDVVRTRFIAQDHNRGYRSVYQAFKEILTREGPRGLFRGVIPSVTAIAPNAGIQFGTYNFLIEKHNYLYDTEVPSRHVILFYGALSGIIAKTCTYPLDLVKKRLQIQQFQQNRTTFGKNMTTTGMIDCLVRTFRNERLIGLYKGVNPSIIKSGAISSLYFFFYEEIISAIDKL